MLVSVTNLWRQWLDCPACCQHKVPRQISWYLNTGAGGAPRMQTCYCFIFKHQLRPIIPARSRLQQSSTTYLVQAEPGNITQLIKSSFVNWCQWQWGMCSTRSWRWEKHYLQQILLWFVCWVWDQCWWQRISVCGSRTVESVEQVSWILATLSLGAIITKYQLDTN